MPDNAGNKEIYIGTDEVEPAEKNGLFMWLQFDPFYTRILLIVGAAVGQSYKCARDIIGLRFKKGNVPAIGAGSKTNAVGGIGARLGCERVFGLQYGGRAHVPPNQRNRERGRCRRESDLASVPFVLLA